MRVSVNDIAGLAGLCMLAFGLYRMHGVDMALTVCGSILLGLAAIGAVRGGD